jgi:hypothetical protein
MNIPTTDYPALISIINQTYTSGIDAILAAKMVGKNKMLVLGQDGSKQLAIELSPENIAIKWINSGQKPPKKGAESFGESSHDDALLNAAVVSMARLVGIDLPISFSEAPVLDLDEEYAEGGKAFKCKPENISCKGRCISGWKVCREGMNAGQIKMVDKLLKSLKAEKAAGIEDGKAAKGLGFVQQVTAKMQELKANGEESDFDKAVEALTPKFEPSKGEEKPVIAAKIKPYAIPKTGQSSTDATDSLNDWNGDVAREILGFELSGYRFIMASTPAGDHFELMQSVYKSNAYYKNGGVAKGLHSFRVNPSLTKEKEVSKALVSMGLSGDIKGNGEINHLMFDSKTNRFRNLTAKETAAADLAYERAELHDFALTHLSDGLSTYYSDEARAAAKKEESATTKKLWSLEDKELGRKPKKSEAQHEEEIVTRAKSWAKEQGFTVGGVNGFSADATAAHDVAHPATHALLGLDTPSIHEAFGSLKTKEGKPSLIAEEALVNAVEHLSRGDTLEASIQNGLRLARVQSRPENGGSEEERVYARSPEFARGIIDLIKNRAYKHPEYSRIMPVVQKYNMKSGTVTSSGADFTNSASGG